ncbi:MAG: GNAT family N-acetyltransferase [Deltaproteobacteria bacterium]|nr:GNAT family N-acetyltransferase [Deltaproteobacteria bacterium]
MIEQLRSPSNLDWLRLRQALWPHCSGAEHETEMARFVAEPERYAQFIFYTDNRQAVGFVEASIRSDYVNGTESSPVAFLEGLYVVPKHRSQGVARRLVGTVAEWAKSRGCSELASDVLFDNEVSHAVHKALGFEETERVVFYRKHLS